MRFLLRVSLFFLVALLPHLNADPVLDSSIYEFQSTGFNRDELLFDTRPLQVQISNFIEGTEVQAIALANSREVSLDLRNLPTAGGITGGSTVGANVFGFYTAVVVPNTSYNPAASIPILTEAVGHVTCDVLGPLSSASGSISFAAGFLRMSANCGSGINVLGPPDANFDILTDVMFPVNTPQAISKQVSASTTNGYLIDPPVAVIHGGATVSAFVDPVLQIDPNFEFASDYHLEFSPGVDLVDVPEPNSFVLGLMFFFGCTTWYRSGKSA